MQELRDRIAGVIRAKSQAPASRVVDWQRFYLQLWGKVKNFFGQLTFSTRYRAIGDNEHRQGAGADFAAWVENSVWVDLRDEGGAEQSRTRSEPSACAGPRASEESGRSQPYSEPATTSAADGDPRADHDEGYDGECRKAREERPLAEPKKGS